MAVLDLPAEEFKELTLVDTHLKREFISAEGEEEAAMLKDDNPHIEKALGVLKLLSGDEEARFMAEARQKARLDYKAQYDGGFRDGLALGQALGQTLGQTMTQALTKALGQAQGHAMTSDMAQALSKALTQSLRQGEAKGRQEGRLEGRLAVAENALRKDMPLPAIAEITGLSLAEIEALAASLSRGDS